MKIVILDGYTLNPGDLSWDALKALGDVEIYERSNPTEVLERATGASILLTNKTPLGKHILEQLPGVKFISLLATGYNVVDVKFAAEKGIVVSNVPGYGTASVVQMTFALLLEFCLHVQRHSDAVTEGRWSASKDFCFWDYPLIELQNKTLGIIGFGDIGQKVADVATAFGMQIVAHSRTQSDQSHRKNFKWATLEKLLQQADVVTIHSPLTPETTGLINKQTLQLMKPSAFLINTSRGQIIIDQDLADALNNGTIAGAGIDVLSAEPPPADNPLLKALGDVEIYERSNPTEVLERATGASILLTNKTPLGKHILEQLPGVKFISLLATGYNVVDVKFAAEKGIVVSNVPGYGTASVVQMTFALLLEFCLHVQRHSDAVTEGRWSASKDFCFWDYPLIELQNKTLGIIGFGDIGQKVADVATAFGMQIVAHSRTQSDQSHRKNFKWATLEKLLQQADVVTIHSPLTPETTGLINKQTLQLMKPSAFLINTSRGQIIIDQDLADALNNGTIAGAGIDVLSAEPPPADNPLLKAKNCIITPHISWATKEARARLLDIATNNVKAFLEGKAVNLVN